MDVVVEWRPAACYGVKALNKGGGEWALPSPYNRFGGEVGERFGVQIEWLHDDDT